MSRFKLAALALAGLAAALLVVPGSSGTVVARETPKTKCRACHTCDNPTAADPCLSVCPRLSETRTIGNHSVAEAPGLIVLNKLVNQYGAVHFNHKLHAEMSGMNQGCTTCHHYSPDGKIMPCSQCHGKGDPNNLGQPGLKGAFHRQCIACHREWSHDTDCKICHMPLEGQNPDSGPVDQTDIIGISHPRLNEPDKKIYYTDFVEAPVVSFFHKEHTELFNLRCVDCHSKESCNNCHDIEKPVRTAKTQEEVHAICSGCHARDRCDRCHDTKERPGFQHASTGWPLDRYHAAVECRGCHPTGKRISKLRAECAVCHGGWNPENFRHAVTGLQLDETHAQADCADCHKEKRYDARPDCSGCHDDNRTHQSVPPGNYIKTRG